MSETLKERSAQVPFEVALLTPQGRGAVACVGVRGDDAWRALATRWTRADWASQFDPANVESSFRPYFGVFHFDELGGVGDEIVLRRRTSTAFELDGHGGDASPSRIVRFFVEQGARVVSGDAWERAVELDEQRANRSSLIVDRCVDALFYADAESLLTQTTTERTAKLACDLREKWRAFFEELASELLRASEITDSEAQSQVCAQELARKLDAVLESGDWARRLVEPFDVALIGAANVGKSSLLNAILGYERAVVSSVEGTTRDLVGALRVIDGWNFRFVDAAGLRDTQDQIELNGARLAVDFARNADLVLFVCDPTRSRLEQRALFKERLGADTLEASTFKTVYALNKIDLPSEDWRDEWKNDDESAYFSISARSGVGIEKLLRAILTSCVDYGAIESTPGWHSLEQASFLRELRDLCACGDFEGALRTLESPVNFDCSVPVE